MDSGCPSCGVVNRTESLYCRACGTALSAAAPNPFRPPSMPCPRCSSLNAPGTSFCYSCGLPLDEFAGTPMRTAAGVVRLAGTPAGFWIRLVAWLIDSLVLVGAQLILLTLMPGTSIEAYYTDNSLWTASDTIMSIFGAIYYTVGVSVFSTTVGKRALGLYVLRPDATKVGGLRALGRYFAGGLSSFLLGIGFLMIAFSSEKRGLHDHICDTVVVRK